MDRRRPSRLGFTLVELLMVVVIIGILIGLLVPTLAAAFRRAKEASVSAELNNLATALASFKNLYGDYPPSRVILPEQGFTAYLASAPTTAVVGISGDADDSDLTYPQLAQRSLIYLRKFWPRANFATATTTTFNDFNGNGHNDGTIILSGSECLAFFLGGIPIINNGVVTGVSGFSKSPTNPFVNTSVSTNRTTPNYEFTTGRLIDLDGDLVPSYIDPIDASAGNRSSYAYFSSYGTNGYDPNDVNGNGHASAGGIIVPELEDNGTTDVERGFLVNFPVYKSGTSTSVTYAVSPGPNPYTAGPSAVGTVSWINPNSFQLFSSGQDRLWGMGGTYVASGGNGGKLPILPNAVDPGNIHGDEATGVRNRESDNLTNFSNGRLD